MSQDEFAEAYFAEFNRVVEECEDCRVKPVIALVPRGDSSLELCDDCTSKMKAFTEGYRNGEKEEGR